jgi:hypothetical protein
MRQACREKEMNGRRYRCFFELTLQLIGGKWKPVVLYHLAQAGVLRFGELRRGLPGITERMLTAAACASWRPTGWCAARSTARCRPGWSMR